MSHTFLILASFQNYSEAIIIKGRLEAEGIQVFMADNHIIETNPYASVAIGGIKLKVYKEDFIKANHILGTINEA